MKFPIVFLTPTIMHRLLLLRSKTPSFSHLNSPFIKHLTTAATPTTTDSIDPSSSSLTLHFLKNSCGLSPETALSTSRKLQFKTTENPHAVLALLKSYNFTASDIAGLVVRKPKLLLSDPDTNLRPKLDFLQSVGFSGPALITLVTSIPSLFELSLQNKLIRNFNILKSLLHTDYNVVSAIKGTARILVSDLENVLLPEMKPLEDYGVPLNVRLKMFTMHGRCLVDPHNRFEEVFDTVKRLGIKPTSSVFAHAFGVLGRLPEREWKRKLDNFNKLGWSEEQVLFAFAQHPFCMSASSEKIEKNMEFFREKFGWDPAYVSRFPTALSLSFEKRIVPRYRVLSVLNSRGLLRRGIIASHLIMGERVFLERYVLKYCEQVPEIINDSVRRKLEDLGLVMKKQSAEKFALMKLIHNVL